MVAQDDNYDPLDESRYRPTFDVVLRGYDRRQVDDALSTAEDEIASLQKERELAFERLAQYTSQIELLQRDVYSLNQHLKQAENAKVPDRAGVAAQVQEILELAETEAGNIRAKATNDTQEHAAQAQARSKAVLAEADRRLAALDTELATKRDAAEKELTDWIALRHRAFEAEDTDTRQKLAQLTAEAKHRAAQIVAKAEADGQRVVKSSRELANKVVARARAHHEEVTKETSTLTEEQQRITNYLAQMQQTLDVLGGQPTQVPQPPRSMAPKAADVEPERPASTEPATGTEPNQPTRLQPPRTRPTPRPRSTPATPRTASSTPIAVEKNASQSPRERMATLLAALDYDNADDDKADHDIADAPKAAQEKDIQNKGNQDGSAGNEVADEEVAATRGSNGNRVPPSTETTTNERHPRPQPRSRPALGKSSATSAATERTAAQ
jgi:cell division septum initiation protein DivIVA